MSAKALAVFSTNAGTVAASLLAGTTTETSGSLDPVIGGCPMCACSHLAKLGVTRTTPIRAQSAQGPGRGTTEIRRAGRYQRGLTLCVAMSPVGWLQPFLEVEVGPGAAMPVRGPRLTSRGCPVAEQSGRSGKLFRNGIPRGVR